MIGIGVGIDYALFIVTRYRENLHDGHGTGRRRRAAPSTPSGRAVLFAGITVMISLLGMFIMGLAFVRGLAVAAAVSVLVMMLAAITLLPALLGFAGKRVEVTRGRRPSPSAPSSCSAMAGVFTGLALGVRPARRLRRSPSS